MRDILGFFIKFLLFLVVFLAIAVVGAAPVVGIAIANAHWNCTQWNEVTGTPTRVIAGECYVQNGTRWELFDTYVQNHHVDLEQGTRP